MGSEGNDTKKALIQAIEAQLDELAKNTALPESMKIDLLREILAGMNSEDQRGDTNEQS
jgi:DNA-binding TFAR19-related protein (PDSD5 family)